MLFKSKKSKVILSVLLVAVLAFPDIGLATGGGEKLLEELSAIGQELAGEQESNALGGDLDAVAVEPEGDETSPEPAEEAAGAASEGADDQDNNAAEDQAPADPEGDAASDAPAQERPSSFAMGAQAAPLGNDTPYDLSVEVSPENATAGDKVTFTVTLVNNTSSDNDGKKITITPSFADKDLNAAVASQLSAISEVGKIGKNGGSVTHTFTVNLPKDLLGGDYEFDVKATGLTWKDGKVDMTGEESASATVSVASLYKGVRLASAADDGSKISGYKQSYSSDSLQVTFGLTNYNLSQTDYTYKLEVIGHDTPGDAGTDLSGSLTAVWVNALPGATSGGYEGDGSITAGSTAKATVKFDLGRDGTSEACNYNSYDVRLTITDEQGNATTQKATVFRERIDLSSASWTIRDDTSRAGVITLKGVDWLDTLYYENVARDSRVPFNNADEFRAYLSTSSSIDEANERIERYIWDLYEPHVGVAGDYGDKNILWPKDSITPFHRQLAGTVERMGTYTQEDGGVVYDEDYFKGLSKTVSPDLGDGNNKREYVIDIKAKTEPTAVKPAVYAFLIPNHWQMFDKLHATTLTGGNTDKGSILTSVDEMAYLYDIKNALIRFTKFLKAEGDNAAIAVFNTQHAGTNYSLVSKNGRYFTSDMDDACYGLEGWDSFGECEHTHWTTTILGKAIPALSTELAGWEDAAGNPIDLSNVVKTAVAFGGPTENRQDDNGYTNKIDDGKTDWSNIDYVYAIRTDTGTTRATYDGRPMYSWLDYQPNQDFLKAHNKYYTSYGDPNNSAFSICTSEDAIYNQLLRIYRETAYETSSQSFGTVDDVVLDDVVSKEFEVISATTTWKAASGAQRTSTWSASAGCAGDAGTISVIPNADGTTKVSCNYGRLVGTGDLDLKITVRAKADYLGSNNVLTNVGTPDISWTHTYPTSGDTKSFTADYTDKPQANVPLLPIGATGGENVDKVGTEFDLADHASISLDGLVDGTYPQTNGKLVLRWVEIVDGREVEVVGGVGDTSVTYDIENGTCAKDITLPSCKVSSDEVTARTFKLKVEIIPDDATNGLVPVTKKTTAADVVLNWVDKPSFALTITKLDAEDKSALEGVEFTITADEPGLSAGFADAAQTTPLTGAVATDSNGELTFWGLSSGRYTIEETKARPGYQLLTSKLHLRIDDTGKAFLSYDDGVEAQVRTEGNRGYIVVENTHAPDLPLAGFFADHPYASLAGVLSLMAGMLGLALSMRRRRRCRVR
ncbi:MAG: prealbumin-like fold domain-containing protein [Coriobacteriia bacterium]|nr:prealbumin-like fold domain-containing protein [Coriobacteriia bacterium]